MSRRLPRRSDGLALMSPSRGPFLDWKDVSNSSRLGAATSLCLHVSTAEQRMFGLLREGVKCEELGVSHR